MRDFDFLQCDKKNKKKNKKQQQQKKQDPINSVWFMLSREGCSPLNSPEELND